MTTTVRPEGRTTAVADEEDTQRKIRRRQFLTGTIYALTSLILGAITGSAGAYLLGRPREENREEWTDAGELPELRFGTPQEITFERSRVDGWKVLNEKSSAWAMAATRKSGEASG